MIWGSRRCVTRIWNGSSQKDFEDSHFDSRCFFFSIPFCSKHRDLWSQPKFPPFEKPTFLGFQDVQTRRVPSASSSDVRRWRRPPVVSPRIFVGSKLQKGIRGNIINYGYPAMPKPQEIRSYWGIIYHHHHLARPALVGFPWKKPTKSTKISDT